MTNGEWLDYLAQNAPDELAAWFDAEHVETEERALDGDTEPENGDSRERLEAEIESYSAFGILDTITLDMVIGWIDRQAAITERKATKRHELFCETCEAESDKQIAELKQIAESKRLSFADRIRFVNEIDELTAERDELQAALNDICANLSIIATGEPNVIADIAIETIDALIDQCNEYRAKFGKCLDYADAIHALMDDEGMA